MQDKPSGGPSVIALPPLILGAAIALGLVLNFFWPAKILTRGVAVPLGLLVVLGAITLGVLAVREMRGANTPLDVRKTPTRIVTSGIFLRTRNPIYLGMVLLCAGVALLVDSLWLAVMVPLLALVLQKGVIEPEENYLGRNFGEEYLRYKERVRRWF
ncbi:isoprenylcysteine carboxylmethyltransferase family protein [Methylocapsa sp. D3K7]|uniref:methyltransferase family protein n=1 Tax=Methylocapsa sp. D3K7 TaxID=3041435 RepID=UPI00244ED1E9|nr:isoprenylcysteine carboxylmethyltransferase family protein [Methylocapsa sp. D3K7]WGJ14870.1 isoprenylcysteine carboxylmethyltransferase family protein [Methylocapsa sp. D3K7]